MSYLDHIIRCNSFSPDEYLSFIADGEQIGWTKKSFIKEIVAYESVFLIENQCLIFHPSLNTAELRSKAIEPILHKLYKQGVIRSWVGELYSITNTFGGVPHFFMERAAVSYFGVRGYGVHVNGLVEKAGGIHIWIARRTKDKPFWPGKLDQIVAGGQPAGISRMQNVIKESAEEASIPVNLAGSAKYIGEIHYCGETSFDNNRGMSIDTLFNYDLYLPEDFIPVNTDGEVDEFMLMPLAEMAHITDTSNEFKDNCNLVNIDLLLRQGFITESHPDYNQIKQRLYAPATLNNILNNRLI
jgi:isopentenyldiphosphate isomerase